MKYCDTEICLLYPAASFLFNGEGGRLRKRGLAFPYHPSLMLVSYPSSRTSGAWFRTRSTISSRLQLCCL